MFEYFYNETFRRTIIAFGTLFNNILLKKQDNAGDVVQVTKVPLAYGPTQKFLARLEQSPSDLNNPVQITLPRMSFEFVGLNYDTSRKLTTTQSFIAKGADSQSKKVYMPVPYNMSFELSIMTKINDDMLQIVEQILPYFQPAFTLTVDLLDTIGEKKDIPIVLDNISMRDDYEGDFNTRRALIYTLRFTAKTYLYGPVISGVDRDIIKKVSIGYAAGEYTTSNAARDLTYSTTPKAIQSYTDNAIATLVKDVVVADGKIAISDTSQILEKSYITINSETLQVSSIVDSTNIMVTRGAYGTSISNHVSGSEVKLVRPADDPLIPVGDDFGFNEFF